MNRGWVADAHVHVYPAHDPGVLLRAAVDNLSPWKARPDDRLALFLTERTGCRFFASLQAGEVPWPEGWDQHPGDEPNTLWVKPSDREAVLVVAGRQVVTDQRLEVLCLGVDGPVEDGMDVSRTIRRVLDDGGLPVLPWSPGKWQGARGDPVRAAVEEGGPDTLWVGDILMRPRGWPEPAPLRLARKRGLGILPGTDPLPMAGEERLVGRYGFRVAGDGLVATLRAGTAHPSVVGRRQDLPAAGRRWIQNRRAGAAG